MIIQEKTELKYKFKLKGSVVPKARPRVITRKGKTHSYMPIEYTNWMNNAVANLAEQKLQYLLKIPIDYFKIIITVEGDQNRNGDLDNIAGSILDALVKARVIANDNLNHIDTQLFKFIPSTKKVVVNINLYTVERKFTFLGKQDSKYITI